MNLEETTSKFHKHFGQSIVPYVKPLTGFDIVKFDKNIGTPDGQSTEDYIIETYGQDACDFIRSLISEKPEEMNKDLAGVPHGTTGTFKWNDGLWGWFSRGGTIAAELYYPLALHSEKRGNWIVTHLPTSYIIPAKTNKKCALKMLKELLKVDGIEQFDYTQISYESIMEIVQRYRGE